MGMLVINSFENLFILTIGKISIKWFITFKLNFMEVTFYTLTSSAYPNDIRYVGKTRQTIKRRLQGHICSAKKAAKKGYCTNHNYNWINQQLSRGNSIIIEEIETVHFEEGEDWQWLEKYWIAQFKEWGFNLTNIKEGGEDNYYTEPTQEVIRKRAKQCVGRPRTEQTKQDISKALSCQNKSEETINKIRKSISEKQGRPVLQLTKSGELIKEWLTGAEAARELKLDKANLNACCKGKKKSCGGYIWKYKYPDVIPETKIVQMDLNGNVIKVFKNSAEAGRELGIEKNLINNVCKGKQPETYHFVFKYYNDVFKTNEDIVSTTQKCVE